MSDISFFWEHYFPNAEPVAYLLRTLFPERWIRFHSLLLSKRYPDTEDEYLILLERHNRILNELNASGQKLTLFTTGCSAKPYPDRTQPSHRFQPDWSLLDPAAIPWRTVAMHEIDNNFENPHYWHIFISQWDWKPKIFDPILRLVADDAIENVMIASPVDGWLFAPYDGGMDLFLKIIDEFDHFKSLHHDWLPNKPDYL